MAGNYGDRSPEETPTGAVAIVCAVFVIVYFLIELGIHSLGKVRIILGHLTIVFFWIVVYIYLIPSLDFDLVAFFFLNCSGSRNVTTRPWLKPWRKWKLVMLLTTYYNVSYLNYYILCIGSWRQTWTTRLGVIYSLPELTSNPLRSLSQYTLTSLAN